MSGAPGKAFQNVRRNARDLEVIAFSLHAKAQVLQPVGQPDAKRRLEIRGVSFEVAELAGLPAAFFVAIGRVEDEYVGVQLRIGQTLNRP